MDPRTRAARFLALFRGRGLDVDLDQELRAHLEMAVERNLRQGLEPEQARRQAFLDLGGMEQTKQDYREQRGLPMIETALQDLRFGFRMLRRSPGFSALAILCLTLGIGANAAVFSWIEGILFRPYPMVAHQERLMALWGTEPGEAGGAAISWPDLMDLRNSCTLIDSFIVTKITGSTLSIGDRAEVFTGSIVSANYFDAIGVHPVLGRGFEPGEDQGRNAHPVTVISYQLWQGRGRCLAGRLSPARLACQPHGPGAYSSGLSHLATWAEIAMVQTFTCSLTCTLAPEPAFFCSRLLVYSA